jgi:tetratricopeptide (TPR) repeat protein
MNNKKLVVLNSGIAVLVISAWWMISNWKTWGENDQVGMQFVALMGFTVVIGFFVVLFVLPTLGDKIGAFFYSAPEKIEPDAFSKASSKIAQGDYEGAVAAYAKIAVDEPENRFPGVEIAKLQQDNLGDVDAAIATLEGAIEGKGWEIDDAAFLIFRLEDIYLKEKGDVERSKELLELVIERFPETRHSANAHHRLNEMNQPG